MKIRFIVKEQMKNPQDVAQNLPSDEQEATRTRESLRTTMDQLDLNTLDTTQMKALQGFISGLQNNMSERKKFTKKDIKKRDDIAKSISTKALEKRYGVGKDEAENIKYAIAADTVKKSKKKKK